MSAFKSYDKVVVIQGKEKVSGFHDLELNKVYTLTDDKYLTNSQYIYLNEIPDGKSFIIDRFIHYKEIPIECSVNKKETGWGFE